MWTSCQVCKLLNIQLRTQQIVLQNSLHDLLISERKRRKMRFITNRLSNGYKELSKRCPFTLQKTPFCNVKDALLRCKRACFKMQKSTYWFVGYHLSLQSAHTIILFTLQDDNPKGRIIDIKKERIKGLLVLWYVPVFTFIIFKRAVLLLCSYFCLNRSAWLWINASSSK